MIIDQLLIITVIEFVWWFIICCSALIGATLIMRYLFK